MHPGEVMGLCPWDEAQSLPRRTNVDPDELCYNAQHLAGNPKNQLQRS